MKRLLLSIVFILLTVVNSLAGDVYISPTGNDDTGDGSVEEPYASFVSSIQFGTHDIKVDRAFSDCAASGGLTMVNYFMISSMEPYGTGSGPVINVVSDFSNTFSGGAITGIIFKGDNSSAGNNRIMTGTGGSFIGCTFDGCRLEGSVAMSLINCVSMFNNDTNSNIDIEGFATATWTVINTVIHNRGSGGNVTSVNANITFNKTNCFLSDADDTGWGSGTFNDVGTSCSWSQALTNYDFEDYTDCDFGIVRGSDLVEAGTSTGVSHVLDQEGNVAPYDGNIDGTDTYDVGAVEFHFDAGVVVTINDTTLEWTVYDGTNDINILIENGVTGTIIRNCNILNANIGIKGDTFVLYNNILNNIQDLDTITGSTPTGHNNWFREFDGADDAGDGPGNYETDADESDTFSDTSTPLYFKDEANGDYRLTDESPTGVKSGGDETVY